MADVEQKVDATTAEQVSPSEKEVADGKNESTKKEETENAGDTEQNVTGKEEEQKAADTNEQKEETAPAKEEEQKEAGATSEIEQKVSDSQPTAEEVGAEGRDAEDVEPEPATDDITRDPDEFRRALRKGQMAPGLTAICHNLGFTTTGVNSALYLDIPNQVILTKGGNFARILDLKTLKSKYIEGLDGAGVGAIAVTNDKKYFAVGCIGEMPNVYIYQYPSLQLMRVLQKGTEKGYSCMFFNSSSNKIATVGAAPDFMMTVWDWRKEKIILRTKAFGQEVFRVTFMPQDDGLLTTSGVGHIRFWRMAQTFTGLKLQGDIGKFGKCELSDIRGYAELPDTQVLSGSETGNLLMWEGNFIKTEVFREGKKRCHEGDITFVALESLPPKEDDDKPGKMYFVSAGADGYIRWWDYEKIDDAEVEEGAHFEIEPLTELMVGDGVKISSMLRGDDHWIVLDANGAIWKVPLQGPMEPEEASVVTSFHGGSITGVDACPNAHLAASCGSDGTVRCWDYTKQATLFQSRFTRQNDKGETVPCAATALRWVTLKADPSARSVAVGFSNGVVRILMRGKNEWKPLQVFKPHKKEITDIQFSDDGTLLATASLDGTVFFHRIKSPSGLISTEYEPLMYHNLGEPVLRCNWRHDGRAVLATCASKITELRIPEQFEDTKVSFLIELDKTEYVFERRPVVKEPKEGEEEAEEEEEDEEEEEELPIIHSLAYYRSGSNDFYLTIEPQCEADQGIHHCSLGIQYALKTDRGQNMNITFMGKSISGKFLLSGADDGSVAIRMASQSRVDTYSMASLHSRQDGRVNQAVLSYDDKFLLSAGADSQLFVVRVKPEHIESIAWAESKKDADAKTKAALEQPFDDLSSFDSGVGEGKELDVTIEDFPQVTDIVKDSTYTLEESLLKTEEDRRKNEAEVKKERVRAQVRALQRTLNSIRERNNKLAPRARLPEKGFEVDPEAVRLLEVKRKEKLAEIRQMHQFDMLQSKIALQKLQLRFLDQVEVESIVLRAFGSEHSVCSFRQQRLSSEFKAALARVYEANKAEAESKEKDAAEGDETNAQTKQKDDKSEDTAKKQAKAKKKGKKKQSQWEVRKEMRKIRTAKMKALMKQKPKLDTVDPQDVADLQEAEDTMGDYKLKSGANYVVPESRKTNADKKHRQMVLMQFEMYKVQSAYNNRFLLLRETKSNIVELANNIMRQIDALNAELDATEAAPSPVRSMLPLSIDIAEWPDTRQRVSQESLTAFKDDNTDLWTGHVCVESSTEQVTTSPEASLAALVPVDHVDDQQRVRARIKSKIVELEEKVDKMLNGFDDALRNLALEKCKLDIRIKSAQARFLVMYQELQLLQDFQKKDELLALRMAKNNKDADAARTSIIDVEGKLEAKRAELAVWQGKSNENMEEFENLVGPQSKFHKPLLKIFKRRIKRRKDANDGEAEGADSETESESDSDDEDYSDDDEEEICPNGCDQDLYDKVRELRERRLDTEEILNNFQKEVDDLKKQRDRFLQRQKQIVKDVEGTKLEMQAFQNEKQRGMNELDIVLAIPISETRCLSADSMPDQVEELLFFPSDRFKTMQARKDELVDEKKKLWMKYKEQQRRGRRLEVIKKDKEKIISQLNDKCTDLQMLKFGQIIDLNSLDRMAVSSQVVDLKEKIRVQEQKNELLVNAEKRKLKKAAQELMQVTHANTQKLTKIGVLTERMHSLQLNLDAGTDESNIVSAEDPSASKDARERRKLVHLVRLQAREVDALKTEINLLRRKGGHMYAGDS